MKKRVCTVGVSHTTISLICMSTHKAVAARCLSYHQATSRQPAIRALATAPLRRLSLNVLFTIVNTSYQTTCTVSKRSSIKGTGQSKPTPRRVPALRHVLFAFGYMCSEETPKVRICFSYENHQYWNRFYLFHDATKWKHLCYFRWWGWHPDGEKLQLTNRCWDQFHTADTDFQVTTNIVYDLKWLIFIYVRKRSKSIIRNQM